MIFADVSPTDASVAKTVSVWLNGSLYGYVVPACLDPAVGDTVIVPAKHHPGCSDPNGPDHQNLYLVRVAKLRVDGYDGPLKTVQCGHGPDCPHDTGLLSANGAIKDMSGIDNSGSGSSNRLSLLEMLRLSVEWALRRRQAIDGTRPPGAEG